MQSFGEQLIAVRKKKGMTQEQLAAAMNMTRQGISNWERNRTLPDIEAVKQLSQILDYDFSAYQENAPQTEEAPVSAKKKSSISPLLIGFIAGVLVAVLVMQVFVPLLSKESAGYSIAKNRSTDPGPETIDWFRQKRIPISGKPYISITYSENPLMAEKDPSYPNGFGWNFSTYFTEHNGLDFYPEKLTFYLFMDESHSTTIEYTKEDMESWWGESKIPARGQQCVGCGEPLQEILGIGMKLSGKDASGEEMYFLGYIEFSQNIKD